MNSIETLLDQPIFQALGWTLIHFIWQGALIAVLYLCVSVLLRRFAANVRGTIRGRESPGGQAIADRK